MTKDQLGIVHTKVKWLRAKLAYLEGSMIEKMNTFKITGQEGIAQYIGEDQHDVSHVLSVVLELDTLLEPDVKPRRKK
jgi:hypothetical protein